jgi:large conductance mechanosensitive channel
MAIDYRSKAALVTGKTGSLWAEFKNFAFKGNMIDLAVAVVLGAAFAKVIDTIVKGIIMPLISYVDPGKGGGYEKWALGRIQIGLVVAELLNFLLVALAVFIVIVKVVGALMKRAVPPPAPGEPTTKECPYCLMAIPIKATRCGHCTSQLPETALPAAATPAV